MSNRKDVRYFLDMFGIDRGRLIAELPKKRKWQRAVYEVAQASNCGDIELKYIEERLLTIGEKMMCKAQRHPYDGAKDWLVNAECCQEALRGIVARNNPHAHPKVLLAEDLDENNPLWKVPTQIPIGRDAESMSHCAAPLFSVSEELLLVDPHFTPTEKKWKASLQQLVTTFLQVSLNCNGLDCSERRIEVHLEHKSSSLNWPSQLEEVKKLLPKGARVRFFRWKEDDFKSKPHARYILTDVGGIQIDYGLDAAGRGTTHATLLDDSFYEQTWREYQEQTAKFRLSDVTEVVGTGVT